MEQKLEQAKAKFKEITPYLEALKLVLQIALPLLQIFILCR